VFGIVFLGTPRTKVQTPVKEVEKGMLIPQYMIAFLLVVVGLLPLMFIRPLVNLVSYQFHLDPVPWLGSVSGPFTAIPLISMVLIILVAGLYFVRRALLKSRVVTYGLTWGCGYTAGTSRQQYTGTSYANNFAELAQPLLQSKDEFAPINDEEIFPSQRSFSRHPNDIFRFSLNKSVDFTMLVLKKLARLQTGNVQHYILYAFLFILVIFTLLFLNIL
jgi:hydrogenase-4 component B